MNMNEQKNVSSQFQRELRLFIAASFAIGMAYSLFDAVFNNFLSQNFALTGFQRSFLEFPRELPGFLVAFVSALLWFLCSRRLGAIAMLFGAVGSVLVGFASPTYGVMTLWLFVYSLGQHIFLPISSTIAMELAKEGNAGRRLGQVNAIRNVATIVGSFLVFLGFKFLGFGFGQVFAAAALLFIAAGGFLFAMTPQRTPPSAMYLTFHREYRLFYLLSILYGSRKQLFVTFAPWVLVAVFHQPTQTLAKLLTLGGVIGILFQPLLGWATDRLGERFVLTAEAALLIVVCFGYGFGSSLFAERAAFLIACACFLLDQMLMSVNMARATYMRKIALESAHIQPSLTLSVTIDHLFSISIALLGGKIWNAFGFRYVFLMGAVIALVNLVAVQFIRVPKNNHR